MTRAKQAKPKPKKAVVASKKITRMTFIKTSLRATPQVDKTSIERDYFQKLKLKHAQQAMVRKKILSRFVAPSVLQCPKCKMNNVAYEAVIGRSQDEDLIKQCKCRSCDYKYAIK